MSREIFCEDVSFDNGEIYCADVTLGQTVIVKEGPEEYTGPVTITPTTEEQTLQTADKLVKSNISMGAIPSEYIIPTGTEVISVTENGTVTADVTNKANVTVNTNVPIPPGYIIPTGNMEITENGTYDVTEKASVTVNVPTFIQLTQAEYDALTTKDPDTLYVIVEE